MLTHDVMVKSLTRKDASNDRFRPRPRVTTFIENLVLGRQTGSKEELDMTKLRDTK